MKKNLCTFSIQLSFLSHLANHVRPRSVASIHVPSAAVVSLIVTPLHFNFIDIFVFMVFSPN